MSNRQILYVTISFAAIFSLISFYFIFSLPSRRSQLGQEVSRKNLLEKKHRQLSELLSLKSGLAGAQELLREALPPEEGVPTLMTQIEGVGRLSGVRVTHLGFSLPVEAEASGGQGKGVAEGVTLTVVATGSREALRTFLTNLEKTSRVITVTNLRFSQVVEATGGDEVSSTLGVSAFFLPEVGRPPLEQPVLLEMTSKEFTDVIAKVKSLRVYQAVPETVEVGKEELFE